MGLPHHIVTLDAMPTIRLLWSFLLLLCLSSCFDLVTRETAIYGPYYVASDPAASYKTLFYRAGELDVDRFQNVSRVGYKAGYIFIKSENLFYWFAVKNDRPTDLGDPAIDSLISKPLTEAEFNRLLATLKIGDIDYQFNNE
jgi:hypothetical protein